MLDHRHIMAVLEPQWHSGIPLASIFSESMQWLNRHRGETLSDIHKDREEARASACKLLWRNSSTLLKTMQDFTSFYFMLKLSGYLIGKWNILVRRDNKVERRIISLSLWNWKEVTLFYPIQNSHDLLTFHVWDQCRCLFTSMTSSLVDCWASSRMPLTNCLLAAL